MKRFVGVLIFVFSFSAFAVPGNSGSLVLAAPTKILRNEVVVFKPIAEHHFSLEAKQSCGNGRLIEVKSQYVRCQFVEPGPTEASLNVCDDKATYCKPVSLALVVDEKPSAEGELTALTQHQTLNQKLKAELVPGFSEYQAKDIKQIAKEKGVPVFVMVSTDWCPPCNETKEHLIPTKGFKSASQNWLKVYVDGDSLQASEWEPLVPYRYFPSFVLLNDQMQEIGRFTGKLRESAFVEWAKEAEARKNNPIAQLKETVLRRAKGEWKQKFSDWWKRRKSAARDKDFVWLLKWAFDMEDHKLIDELLAVREPVELESEIINYQIARLKDDEKLKSSEIKARQVKLYERLLTHALKKEDWSSYLLDFCTLDSTACGQFVDKYKERIDFVIAKGGELNVGERASWLAEEFYFLSDTFELLGQKDRQKEVAKACVQQSEVMLKQSPLSLSRAGNQGLVSCLMAAKLFPEAKTRLKILIATYPNEPTFHIKLAKVFRAEKKPEDALKALVPADAVAYGYNWFSLQLLRAEILVDLKRSKEAEKIAENALQKISLNEREASRNQVIVSRFRQLQAKIR